MELTVRGPLRGVAGSKTLSIPDPDGEATVREVLELLVETHPRAESHLFADDGSVRPSVRVVVDGEAADPDAACPPTADVAITPAIRGGARRRSDDDR